MALTKLSRTLATTINVDVDTEYIKRGNAVEHRALLFVRLSA